MSKERPILFSAPMVRAILEGRKTQTRRIVKPEHVAAYHDDVPILFKRFPYGKPGDRLWVRETWGMFEETHKCIPHYRATHATDVVPRWRPSIHMPRWASRITLEVESVRVERLKECSDADALAEGCSSADMQSGDRLQDVYRRLWESINGPGSWEANPWVWVVEFKRIQP
jgi:hypothetical protein